MLNTLLVVHMPLKFWLRMYNYGINGKYNHEHPVKPTVLNETEQTVVAQELYKTAVDSNINLVVCQFLHGITRIFNDRRQCVNEFICS